MKNPEVISELSSLVKEASSKEFSLSTIRTLRKSLSALRGKSSQRMFALLNAIENANNEIRRVKTIAEQEIGLIQLDNRRLEAIELDRLEKEKNG